MTSNMLKCGIKSKCIFRVIALCVKVIPEKSVYRKLDMGSTRVHEFGWFLLL